MAAKKEAREVMEVTEVEVIAGEDGGYFATTNGGGKYKITPSEYERIRDNFRCSKKSHLDIRETIGVSAENWGKSKSVGSLTVDVSEALTGLKAVQREAKKATQALRELEAEKKRQDEEFGKLFDAHQELAQRHDGLTLDLAECASIFSTEVAPPGPAEYFWEKVRDLSNRTTAELTEELAKREGSENYRTFSKATGGGGATIHE